MEKFEFTEVATVQTLNEAVAFLTLNNIENFIARYHAENDNTVIFKSSDKQTLEENIERFKSVIYLTSSPFYIIETGVIHNALKIKCRNEKEDFPTLFLKRMEPLIPHVIPALIKKIMPDIPELNKEQKEETAELEKEENNETIN